MNEPKTCSVSGCTRPLCARGLCDAHYKRLLTHGEVDAARPVQPYAQGADLWAHVERTGDGCWLWRGALDRKGYGRVRVGRTRSAHRRAYEVAFGPIPPGKLVCHRCDRPACVRPDHLFLGSAADNSHDMVAKVRQARGERSGSRLHPERVAHGERKGNAKLTDARVRELRRLRAEGWTFTRLGATFGVNEGTARYAAAGRTWAHVSEVAA